MIGSHLSQLEREFTDMVNRIRQMEEISVPAAAALLKKDVEWVRTNLPIIIHSSKSHHVRLVDVEAYQSRRTVWPKWLRNGSRAKSQKLI